MSVLSKNIISKLSKLHITDSSNLGFYRFGSLLSSSLQELQSEKLRLTVNPKLKPKPDGGDLKFGQIFTDHMLSVTWSETGGWGEPRIMPLQNLSLHPACKVFHYAQELFEGMKAYRGVDGRVRLFRPDLNMARMNMTAERSCLPTRLSTSDRP